MKSSFVKNENLLENNVFSLSAKTQKSGVTLYESAIIKKKLFGIERVAEFIIQHRQQSRRFSSKYKRMGKSELSPELDCAGINYDIILKHVNERRDKGLSGIKYWFVKITSQNKLIAFQLYASLTKIIII